MDSQNLKPLLFNDMEAFVNDLDNYGGPSSRIMGIVQLVDISPQVEHIVQTPSKSVYRRK
jgi:hypothetical protein